MKTHLTSSLRSLGSSSRSMLRRKDKNGDEQSTSTQSTSHMTDVSASRARPSFPKNTSRRGRLLKSSTQSSVGSSCRSVVNKLMSTSLSSVGSGSSRSLVNKKRIDSLWDSHSGLPLGATQSSHSRGSKQQQQPQPSLHRRRREPTKVVVMEVDTIIEEVPQQHQQQQPSQETPVIKRKVMDRPVEKAPKEQLQQQQQQPTSEKHKKEDSLPDPEQLTTGLPSFLDMIIEVPVNSRSAPTLPMVIEIPKTESDSDDDDEDDDDNVNRAWCVVSVGDDTSLAEDVDEEEDTVDDDQDEIHNKVRNLATMLRRQTSQNAAVRAASMVERRTS